MFKEKIFTIDNVKMDWTDLELIYNQIYGAKSIININVKNDTISATQNFVNSLYNLYEDIKENTILVKIFETKREMIKYIFVEGQDTEQLTDSFMCLLENKDYNLSVEYSFIEWNGKYIYIQY